MKRIILVLAGWFLVGSCCCTSLWAVELAWRDIAAGALNLNTVLIDEGDVSKIFIGTKNGVSKTEDSGQSWRVVLSVSKPVNFLSYGLGDKNIVYAATGSGLYLSSNAAKSWRRVFKGKNSLEDDCTAIATIPWGIFLGTKAGLFVSCDNAKTWQREFGKIGKSHILALAFNPQDKSCLYAACCDGVYKKAGIDRGWERVFVANPKEDEAEREGINEDTGEELKTSEIRHIVASPAKNAVIYLATSKGVYRSIDKGLTWNLLPDAGLLNKEVSFVFVSQKSDVFAVTKSGIFEFRDSRWYEISLGLPSQEIRFLTQDRKNALYAACSKGLYKATLANNAQSRHNTCWDIYLQNEPKIEDIQRAAIVYAEVEPQKIMCWRRQAARRAFLPKISTSVSRDTSDLWHWETGSSTRAGDDALVRGKEVIGWDITLSWDLTELIWNNDQTSIDVRSRLMVQLRDDILDEVNKLYFERLRLKLELDNLAIEEKKKMMEKELRIQELTASLDGLTGGYFSQTIVTQIKTES